MSRVEVVFYSSFTQKGRWRSGDNSTLIGSRHKLSLKGVLQLDLNRFALYRQLKVCFWSEFTKNQLKNSLNGVIVKIVIYKSQNTMEKLQNKQWELSNLSFNCYFEF